MAHWNDYNPWADKVIYLPDAAELSACLDPQNSTRHVRTWQEYYGNKFDIYILPQPSGMHECGIRYGKQPEQYLSPYINKYIAELLISKYKNTGA